VRLFALALAAVILSPAAVSAAEREIASQPRPTEVRSYDGIALFSSWTGSAYRLSISRGGRAPETLPLPEQASPFDADIGPDTTGRPTIVVSRCDATRCGLFTQRIGSSTLRPVPATGRTSVRPSVWRDEVVWVEQSNSRVKPSARLLRRRLTDGARVASRSVPGVPRGGAVEEVELHGRRVALSTTIDNAGICGTREIRLVDIPKGDFKVIASQICGLNGQNWVGPSFARGSLYFARFCAANASGCGRGSYGAFRYRISDGATALAQFGRFLTGWAYDDAGRAYEARDPAGDCAFPDQPPPPCTVVRVTGLRFAKARAPR